MTPAERRWEDAHAQVDAELQPRIRRNLHNRQPLPGWWWATIITLCLSPAAGVLGWLTWQWLR